MGRRPGDAAEILDAVVIGAGQAGLAVGYHLHRHNRDVERHGRRRLTYALLDASEDPGGSWPQMWASLRLFSPAAYSSLPGRRMPPAEGSGNPSASHVADYLASYEERYELPVRRGCRVESVTSADGADDADDADDADGADGADDVLTVHLADGEQLRTRHVVSATGTWSRPFIPVVAGTAEFAGDQIHAVSYDRPATYDGRRVLVVGGGNSGAQIAADLMLARERGEPSASDVHWATTRAPRYLPDDVDGRVLFETATKAVRDREAGREPSGGVGSLGDIVATPDVRAARDDLGLRARIGLAAFTAPGARFDDGVEVELDAVIWATGFRPALQHLRPLRLESRDGRPATGPWTAGASPTRAVTRPDVWLVGYGDWCGPASATLIGAGRAARDTVEGLVDSLT